MVTIAKEERTRNFFIDAAKDIIRGEGLAALNVRNIAERAAFSPATLYAYFKDLNGLIKVCVYSFIDELEQFIKQENIDFHGNYYKDYYLSYVKYFVQYPGIYQLLFIEANPILKNDKELIKTIKQIPKNINEKYDIDSDKYFNHINGILFLYLNRSTPASYTDFMERIKILF